MCKADTAPQRAVLKFDRVPIRERFGTNACGE